MNVIDRISSVCPACAKTGSLRRLEGNLVEEQGKLWLRKTCPEHGAFQELYFGDAQLYMRWMKYLTLGAPVSSVQTGGLYENHLSRPVLTHLIVTNRGDSRSVSFVPDAHQTNVVYEPSIDEIRTLLHQTRAETPVGSDAVQIMGGEPTLRNDLVEILKCAKAEGFSHLQLQTNGVKLAESLEYCEQLKAAQLNTVYLSFSGVTEQTNPLLRQQEQALHHIRETGLPVVLTPMVTTSEDAHGAGRIVRFALDHIDTVRGVHFQLGFLRRSEQNQGEPSQTRVDPLDLLQSIEQEFPGVITRDDFYPFSVMNPLFHLVEFLTHEPQIDFTIHPLCGASTFVFLENGSPLPISRFVDIDADRSLLTAQSKKKGPLRKFRIASAVVRNIDTFIDYTNAPKDFSSKRLLRDAALFGSQYAVRNLLHRTLSIGFMAYQDPMTLNIDRLQRCILHCPTPEGIVPWCAYAGLGYGERIQKKYGISLEEWKKNHKGSSSVTPL